jgi:hypothetical protein
MPAALRRSEDGGLSDFLDHEQLALWPLADGTPDDIRAAGCVYGTLNYGWDLRKKLKPRIPMEDLIADALERVRATHCEQWSRHNLALGSQVCQEQPPSVLCASWSATPARTPWCGGTG